MSTNSFSTVRAAKEYLAGRIADEAGREGFPLTGVERKMLFFSETDWTLPEMMEVNAAFERDYDEDEYERKIAALVRKIEASDAVDEQEQRIWDEAVVKLSEGDNYLSIMLAPCFAPEVESVRPPHDRLELWLTALGIVFGGFGLLWLLNWKFGPKLWALQEWLSDHRAGGLPGLILLVAIVLYWLAKPRVSAAFDRLFNRKKTGNRA